MIRDRSAAVGGVALLAGLVAASTPVAATPPSASLALRVLLPAAGFPVDRFLAHWWVFPASVLFSLVALASGVSGALFFSPFFMLIVGLPPSQAIGAGLLTEVFGMGNGLVNYVRQRVVDYATARWLLLGAVPAVVVGAFAAHSVPTALLKLAFGVGLLLLGGFLVYYDPPRTASPASARASTSNGRTPGGGRRPSRRRTARRSATTPAGDRPASAWRPPAGSSRGSSARVSRK